MQVLAKRRHYIGVNEGLISWRLRNPGVDFGDVGTISGVAPTDAPGTM